MAPLHGRAAAIAPDLEIGQILLEGIAHPLRRDQPAIGPAGKPRLFRAKQAAANGGKNAIGRDQHVGLDLNSVLEPRRHGVAVLFDAHAAMLFVLERREQLRQGLVRRLELTRTEGCAVLVRPGSLAPLNPLQHPPPLR